MVQIIQDVLLMNKIFKILYIFIFILYSNISFSADMAGYLLDQAIKQYNDKNYKDAFTALNNIAPTGNPVAVYLLGNMYLNGYGIKKNYNIAYQMILFAAQQLPNDYKNIALEAQLTLADMYINGTGVIKNNLEAYKWAYIVNLSNNSLASSILIKLQSALSEEEILLASKEGEEFMKKIKENDHEY